MGRPIKQSYFLRGGSTPSDSSFSASNGGPWVGLSMTVATAGTHYPVGTTITIAQGQLGAESQTATATLSISTTTGAITGITVTDVGSGYNDSPAYTLNQPATVSYTGAITTGSTTISGLSSVAGIAVGMKIDETGGMAPNTYVVSVGTTSVVMSNPATNSVPSSTFTFSSNGSGGVISFSGVTPADAGKIATSAWIAGDSQARVSAILKQEASHRYLVENSNGGLHIGQCKLVAAGPASGQMTIIAKDANGSSYYVTKLAARKCRLVQKTMVGSYVYADGTMARWTLGWGNATGTNPTVSGTKVGIETNTN